MCLIIYSPAGALMDYDLFDCAHSVNPDGIGIMSERGVKKFFGPNAADDAWWHLQVLATEQVPHGIHFRFATHGKVSLDNCHPFAAPRSDAYVMHNGIIQVTAGLATANRSDTALFVEKFMRSAPGPTKSRHGAFFRAVSRLIGLANTLLVFHSKTRQFTICNETVGSWIGDHWYSNTEVFSWCAPLEIDNVWMAGNPDANWLPGEMMGSRVGGWSGWSETFEPDPQECSGLDSLDLRPYVMDE